MGTSQQTEFTLAISSPRNISFRVKTTINIDDLGIDPDEWEEMEESERQIILDEQLNQFLSEVVHCYWE